MYTPDTIGAAVADHIKQKFGDKRGNKTAAAAELGMTRAYVSQVLHSRKQPSRRLLQSMGLVKVVTYQAKEPK